MGYRNEQLITISVVTLIIASQAYTRLLCPSHPAHAYLPPPKHLQLSLFFLPSFHPHLVAAPPGTSLNLTLFCHSSEIFSHSSTFSHFLNSISSCSLYAGVILLNSSIPLKMTGRADTRDEGKRRKYTSVSWWTLKKITNIILVSVKS